MDVFDTLGKLRITEWTLQKLNALGGYIMKWLRLPFTIDEIKKKSEKEIMSPDAKLCLKCDRRLDPFDTSNYAVWYFRCDYCKITYRFPAPTAHLSSSWPKEK